jgi:anti-sigma factor RsiW
MTISLQIPRIRVKSVCTSPEDGALLPAYIVDQLDDAQAETVQNHLNDCPRCKKYYLTMLKARSEAPKHALKVDNPDEITPRPSPAKLAENPTPPVRRKGKASGSLV